MPDRSLRRWRLDGDHARQSAAAVVCFLRLRSSVRLRRIGLKRTQFAKANCATIRLKLLKIGALVRISVRRIKLAMASSFPNQREFKIAHVRLAAAAR